MQSDVGKYMPIFCLNNETFNFGWTFLGNTTLHPISRAIKTTNLGAQRPAVLASKGRSGSSPHC